MRNITLEEQHKYLLKIAKIFHDFCCKYEIPYYMLGGTMLGAIRHHDIIPWDDDMDFGVPRLYYNKIVNDIEKELPSYLRLISYKNSHIKVDMLKIELKDSKMLTDDDDNFGIFIDIFPLDYTNCNVGVFSMNKLLHFLVKYNVYAFSQSTEEGLLKKIMRTINILPKSFVINLISKYSESHEKQYSAYANYSGFWGMKEILSVVIFGKPKLYEIGGLFLFGVESPDKYLTSLYGDYMRLPSEEDRHTHAKEIILLKEIGTL